MGLQVYEESGAFVAGAVKALTALATSERNTEEVNQQGGVTQVVRALEAKPEYAEVAVNVCDMIGVCADQGASNSCRACADFMISLLISSFSLLSLPPPQGTTPATLLRSTASRPCSQRLLLRPRTANSQRLRRRA